MQAQEQKQQRRDLGLETSCSQMLTFAVPLSLLLLDGVLPGFTPAFTADSRPQGQHRVHMGWLEIGLCCKNGGVVVSSASIRDK